MVYLKGELKWNFHFVYFYTDTLVRMYSARKHYFNITAVNYWDIKVINIVMYDWAPDVLLFHVLEWLRVIAYDILPRQTIIMTFPFQVLYSLRPLRRYILVRSSVRNGSVTLPLQARLTTYYLIYYRSHHNFNDGVHHTTVAEPLLVDRVRNTDWLVCL